MARPLRVDVAGGWYHVTARGNERRAVFRDERDRQRMLELLEEWVERFGVRLHAWVLLDNHYHVLVETPRANLSPAMQWLGVSYTVWFNRRHRRAGHLFQGRFKAVLLEPAAALEVSRYVHLNPVRVRELGLDKASQVRERSGTGAAPSRAAVTERLQRLRGYRWSSYRAYVGLAEPPEWLTTREVLEARRARDLSACRRKYRQYVEEALRMGVIESPWERLTAGTLLGGAEFIRKWRDQLRGPEREQPQRRALQRGRISFAAVVRTVEALKGQAWADFRDRYGDWGRELVLYLGRRQAGLSLRALAAEIGGVDYSSVAKAVARFGQRVSQERELRDLVRQAKERLSNV